MQGSAYYNVARSAWLRQAWDGYPRELWGGSKYEKWARVENQDEYLAYVQQQVDAEAPVHTSVQIAGVPDSGYAVYWVDKVLLEIDGPDREASLHEMQRMVAFLSVNFGAEPRTYFSGNRSFHTFIDFLPLVLQEPEATLSEFASRLQKAVGGLHLDFGVFARRHLSRLPWTRHEDTGELCLPVDPYTSRKDIARPELAVPVQIRYCDAVRSALVRIAQTPRPVPKRPRPSKAGARYEWIERLLQHPIADGRHRVLWHVLAPYLVNVRRLDPQEAESVLRDYFDRCGALKPLQPSRSQFLREIRNYIRTAEKDGYPPWRLETIERKDPELFAIVKEASA